MIGARGLEERRSIETTGAQQRATQSELLAGQERQIGLTGREERLGIQTSGLEQRATQSQLLAGQERQIGLTGREERETQRERFTGETGLTRVRGEEERAGIRETGSEQRQTGLQQEMFRRYK